MFFLDTDLIYKMSNEEIMLRAIAAARQGMGKGQSPFGACVVKGGEIIAVEHNRVWETTDITAHAEIAAIRSACEKLGTIDLSDCEIFSTTEPCPMCFSAIHWAKISKIYFGTSIDDAQMAGFSELTISNEKMRTAGNSGVEIEVGFMREQALMLFEKWGRMEDRKVY